eukprot:gi/632970768/ref/XP_007901831.1/ PREDICTED: PDZ domain-containing protein 8 [Callorhinchus milii]
MVYVILLSALAGAVCVLLLQLLLIYRNKTEPVPRTEQYVKPVVQPGLRDYLNGRERGETWPPTSLLPPSSPPPPPSSSSSSPTLQPGSSFSSSSLSSSSSSSSPTWPGTAADTGNSTGQSTGTSGSGNTGTSGGGGNGPESCNFLNAIFLFLFRELRDTPIVRHWLTKKIKVELEELLQTRTAGRLLEGLSLRDISLGNALPVFKSAKLLPPPPATSASAGTEQGVPDQLDFQVDLEYNGGFHLAIDVDLVFGKSAYLFVKMRRVVGRLRLQFTRLPFTHWSFAFMEEPFMDFEVKSQFEGRPMPQLTSIIVNQLKRVIKKKHTLPNYKIRYKPFFPFQVLPTAGSANCELYAQDSSLVEGRLKVTVVECSRLFILGSYERSLPIHCTLELSTSVWKEKSRSSIKTVELIKGNSQSVGLTFRHVQGTDGDPVHVNVESVTPNSPAAAADLQRGDRLIAIGGVKVTSSPQVFKLIKQAGDKILFVYERPVGRHQNPHCGSLQENFEDSGFGSQFGQPVVDDDNTLDGGDNRDLYSDFEELVCPEIKLQPAELKEDLTQINHSPKRSVTALATKPMGTISPILNRKLNLGNYPIPLKSQLKDTTKPSQLKGPETTDVTQQPNKVTLGSTNKPPVPPRPQIKVTLASSETQYLVETAEIATERLDKPLPLTNNVEKTAEKGLGRGAEQSEDPPVSKPPVAKQESKERVPEASCGSAREVTEGSHTWESSETLYKKKNGKWSKASCIFEVEGQHKYLNVALWCREPFKVGDLLCLGHASIKLEEIAMECLATASMEFQSNFRLNAPEPRAVGSRTALRNLSTHKGFNEKLCYGDLTLNFTYLQEGDSENSSVAVENEKEDIPPEEVSAVSKEEANLWSMLSTDNKHNFQDTQFQNPTWCEYCKKKVWTKAASKCMICSYVCHKKCQDKCLAETPFCVTTERRSDLEAKTSFNRTGLTRHLINTKTRLMNLTQGPRTRLAEPGVPDLAEPSPKHTPNTSDNESSDTETYSGSSPSKRQSSSSSASASTSTSSSSSNTGTKLSVKKEGGLDDSVFIAVKEIGRDLYRGLPTDERFQKLELMLDKLQHEIDQELEHNNALVKEEKETSDPRKRLLLAASLSKSGERLQALTLLTIHYKAGVEDLESNENASASEQQGRKAVKFSDETAYPTTADDSDVAGHTDLQSFAEVTTEQLIDGTESLS